MKKINEQFQIWSFEESWEIKTFGCISLKVPDKWVARTEPPNDQGHQRFNLSNTDGTKNLMVVRVPWLKDIRFEEIAPLTKQLIEKIIENSPIAGTILKQTNSKSLYGITGPNFIAKAGPPNPFICKAVSLKNMNALVFVLTFCHQDKLQELNSIIQTLEVDGTLLATKF